MWNSLYCDKSMTLITWVPPYFMFSVFMCSVRSNFNGKPSYSWASVLLNMEELWKLLLCRKLPRSRKKKAQQLPPNYAFFRSEGDAVCFWLCALVNPFTFFVRVFVLKNVYSIFLSSKRSGSNIFTPLMLWCFCSHYSSINFAF